MTVPGSCPRVVAEESDGNHGLPKDKLAAKVTKEVSRKGGKNETWPRKGRKGERVQFEYI